MQLLTSCAGRRKVTNDSRQIEPSAESQRAATRRRARQFTEQCSILGLDGAQIEELQHVHAVHTLDDLRLLNEHDLRALGYNPVVVARWLTWNGGGLPDKPDERTASIVAADKVRMATTEIVGTTEPAAEKFSADNMPGNAPIHIRGVVVRSPPRAR